jgi:autophagy-related protein 5
MQCPRYTYLPIILPELRDNFVNSVLAPDELESLASPIEDWWFEVDTSRDGEEAHGNGEMCKWSVPMACPVMMTLMSRLILSLT